MPRCRLVKNEHEMMIHQIRQGDGLSQQIIDHKQSRQQHHATTGCVRPYTDQVAHQFAWRAPSTLFTWRRYHSTGSRIHAWRRDQTSRQPCTDCTNENGPLAPPSKTSSHAQLEQRPPPCTSLRDDSARTSRFSQRPLAPSVYQSLCPLLPAVLSLPQLEQESL